MWAIARDGEVFYRGSVSPQNPAGGDAKEQKKEVKTGFLSDWKVVEKHWSNQASLTPPNRRMLVPHPVALPADPAAALCGTDVGFRCGRQQ